MRQCPEDAGAQKEASGACSPSARPSLLGPDMSLVLSCGAEPLILLCWVLAAVALSREGLPSSPVPSQLSFMLLSLGPLLLLTPP